MIMKEFKAKKIKKASTTPTVTYKTKTKRTVIVPFKATWSSGNISWVFKAYDDSGNQMNLGTISITKSDGKTSKKITSGQNFYISIIKFNISFF